MNEIDFLPLAYHQQSAEERQRPWRVIVVLAFAALLGAAALLDYQRRQRLRAELEAIRPQYEKAVAQMAKLADGQSKARSARAESDLYTYLRHRWMRTQILSALLAPLPEEVVIEQVKLLQEVPRDHAAPGAVPKADAKPDPKAQEAELAKLPAASRDLKRLRSEHDAAHTVAVLTGHSPEGAALHRYLGELAKADLFRKVQLRSLETAKSENGTTLRFVAMVIVRPGYGQPGGPAPGNKAARSQTTDGQKGHAAKAAEGRPILQTPVEPRGDVAILRTSGRAVAETESPLP